MASGTAVSSGAGIVFDLNDPIGTPVWTNTVDLAPPSARAEAQSQTPFEVTASGGDAGAGVGTYAFVVQRAGGEFRPASLTSEPSFTFSPDEPDVYGVYVRLVDTVGNVEGGRAEGEATTSVGVGRAPGPAGLTLDVPFPNPARGALTLRVGVTGAVRGLDVQATIFRHCK